LHQEGTEKSEKSEIKLGWAKKKSKKSQLRNTLFPFVRQCNTDEQKKAQTHFAMACSQWQVHYYYFPLALDMATLDRDQNDPKALFLDY
jgi:hypothetical protein